MKDTLQPYIDNAKLRLTAIMLMALPVLSLASACDAAQPPVPQQLPQTTLYEGDSFQTTVSCITTAGNIDSREPISFPESFDDVNGTIQLYGRQKKGDTIYYYENKVGNNGPALATVDDVFVDNGKKALKITPIKNDIGICP